MKIHETCAKCGSVFEVETRIPASALYAVDGWRRGHRLSKRPA